MWHALAGLPHIGFVGQNIQGLSVSVRPRSDLKKRSADSHKTNFLTGTIKWTILLQFCEFYVPLLPFTSPNRLATTLDNTLTSPRPTFTKQLAFPFYSTSPQCSSCLVPLIFNSKAKNTGNIVLMPDLNSTTVPNIAVHGRGKHHYFILFQNKTHKSLNATG